MARGVEGGSRLLGKGVWDERRVWEGGRWQDAPRGWRQNGGEVVMTTAATNHPEVTQREITLHPIRFKAETGLAIPRRRSPP
uniref:Uncharacterized protein n=1 Tax=Vespula pensylvanica TaxID=30213 RepID=A0A834PJZ4_VESPE|nr:hypothetical protein H0235_001947 [Vespula pensylvanica]